ncbi:ribosomal-protein-alanine N-acetyltransferase [Streptococcus azizii]|uniref:[Ribosomal protein bS18]-alanine N-acetyltransferase n=1 Tax=Streptococcus azizii TaxID=1579424 RepID=A0AB36JNZ8_9STRE|nr:MULTISPECIES: ribosomal protein S18-alanine N-acetyltransferase [Streptococcus]MBF0777060.1 ribosomal protein S18-alanine N-acetyltransferase [Streptococcus sp. 19428wD3_AN2]ONK26199.1 ribosomal-protein-alanine N-acetyltransferase [Streptococcus azizii]ONK26699.1 ribosomal-protein-alanine N-acetyltransferase [Streptococcus azizii]ONK27610.1 ribosomal-protein-alanine N-acetyltransferase [Streptococcus azizii]TFU81693.1 ribosomal-protein-alanine N-acetyltransferase [Streptococcus sp. AN2]
MIEVEKYDGDSAIAQALHAILVDVYRVSPWTMEQMERDLAQPDVVYYLAKQGGTILGFLAVQQLVEDWEILQLAVQKDAQGQGIAGYLLERLDSFLGTVFLEVRASNRRAKRLYQRYGFVEIGKRKDYYHNPIEDAIVMKREKDER